MLENFAISPSLPRRQLHILAVDDCIQDLQALFGILKQHGCKISVAFDGKQGYERARLRKPDLILMDVRMPGMCGLTATAILQSDVATSDIPIIFLSALGDTPARIIGLNHGGADYIAKPFDPHEVVARIAATMRWRNFSGTAVIEGNPFPSEDERLVRATQSFVQKNISKIHNVEMLAKRLGTHQKRLNKAFLRVTNETVAFNLAGLRLARAKDYLVTTNLSITTIAEELGYSSSANFTSAFHLRVGMSPSCFRQIGRSSNVK